MGFGCNWRSGAVSVRPRAPLYTLLEFEANIQHMINPERITCAHA